MISQFTGTRIDEAPVGDMTPGADRAGQLVGDRYRILRPLGNGGMGSVWLAVDCTLHRPVALKELTGSREDRDAHHLGVLREARAACAVVHPGVVRVYGVLRDARQDWIVMEALSGTTLAEAIRQDGSLPYERVVDIGLRLLETLAAIHDEGVIHGDVKPGNVHVTATGQPVLTDFGLASTRDDGVDLEPAQIVGSPPYLAPEVIRTGTRTSASDLFALGATLYEAAEGRRPFEGDNAVATLLSVLHHDPAPAVDGAPLGRVIAELLVKDPRHRLSAREAYALLRESESQMSRSGVGSCLPVAALAG